MTSMGQRAPGLVGYHRLDRRSEMTEERQANARQRMLTIAEENEAARDCVPSKHGVRLLQS